MENDFITKPVSDELPDFIKHGVKPRTVRIKKVSRMATFKRKVIKAIILLSIIIALGGFAAYKVNQFFNGHYLQSPIKLETRPVIMPRETSKHEGLTAVAQAAAIPEWQALGLSGVQKAVCIKFGSDCRTAVAVAQAESGYVENQVGYNCNGKACAPSDRYKASSVDCGVFQINYPGTKCPAALLDVDINIEWAHETYTNWKGFGAWVAFNNGSYKKFLK